MTLEQWDKLAAFIKSEAQYAALSNPDVTDARIRYEYEDEARKALVKELQHD